LLRPNAVAIPLRLRPTTKDKSKKKDDGNGEFGSILHEAAPAYKVGGDKTTANLSPAIDPRYFQTYRAMRLGSLPGNFSFVKDNIFDPQLKVQPTAVVFFGACGAVSDGALDYAIVSDARQVMCRTCCHENIGGNVTVAARPNAVNRFFRFKNRVYDRVRKTPKYAGFYFSPKYAPGAYPRSAAGGRLSSTEEILAVARNSTDSDICRAIIDLDRYLYLAEQGFRVEYQGDMLVAEREA
jgi:hypothetical protein